jgi:phospholipid/cholesterol/gamma-HCH transport system substrate-binding protein
MKENNNRRAVILGIFILIGILIFLAGILTLGGQKRTFEKKVEVRALFEDVGGLQKGNNVWFSGVKIGAIKSMSFTPDSKVEVIMNIEEKARPFIKKDVKAKISSEGFIGNKIVVLYGGSPGSAAIDQGDLIAVEKGLSTDEILATFQENNKNLLDITANIKGITDRLEAGKGSVGRVLTDETLVNTLQAAVTRLKQASSNAEQLTSHISDYAAKLQSKGSLTNDLITDTVIFSSLRTTASQLRKVSITANEITDNLKLVTSNIKQVSDNLNSNHSPVGVLLNDAESGENLKRTLTNLQSGSQKLDENLEALQHVFLLRGFFKKKEKEKEKEEEKAKKD